MNPPILRGHIVDGELVLDRLNNKVFRRLNSLYTYLMDNNVIHIPNRETFAQRKKDLIDLIEDTYLWYNQHKKMLL